MNRIPRSPSAPGPARISRLVAGLLTAATLQACAGGSSEAQTNPPPERPDPPPVLSPGGQPARDGQPFYAGVYLGREDTSPGEIRQAIRRFGEKYGERPALVKHFHTLRSDFSATGWAGQILREVAAADVTSYVGLAIASQSGVPTDTLLADILEGGYDDEIRRVARNLREFGELVLLEPGWEMNGDWQYNWQGIYNNPDAPAKFIAAWRRIVDIFRREGTTNVRWVFNPNTGNPVTNAATGPEHWNWYGYYYPGDDYVDYVGAHAYNAPSLWRHRWRSFAELVAGRPGDNILPSMVERFPDKPIIFGEIASEEEPGHSKAQWILDAYELMIEHPQVVGAIWFDTRKETDWRIDSTEESAEAYRRVLQHPWVVTVFTDPAGPPGR